MPFSLKRRTVAAAAAFALMLLPCLLLAGCSLGQSVEYEVFDEDTAGAIESISIDTEETDVNILFSETAEKISVKYPEVTDGNGRPANEVKISLEGGILRLEERRTLRLFSFFDLDERITVTVPAGRHLNNYELSVETGDVRLADGVKADTVALTATTGDITLGSAVVTEGITLTATTGDIELSGSVAAEEISISVTTGDVDLDSDILANRLRVNGTTSDVTSSGTVKTALLSVSCTTGDVSFDGVLDAKVTEIDLTTGNVGLCLIGSKDWYSITAQSTTGDCNVSGGSGERTVSVESTTGDVKINFAGLKDPNNNI